MAEILNFGEEVFNSPTYDFFDPEQHHLALEDLAVDCLSNRDPKTALQFADRRCRILPGPKASHFILRADALYALSFLSAALRDIEKALELAPDDLAANRRMMAWGDQNSKMISAQRLVAQDHDFSSVREAIKLLEEAGQSRFSSLKIDGSKVHGWVAWRVSAPATLRDPQRKLLAKIHNDPNHALSQDGRKATNVEIDLSSSEDGISLWFGQRPHSTLRSPWKPGDESHPPSAAGSVEDANYPHTFPHVLRVTIIIPVYDDFLATKRCIEGVMAEVATDERISVVLIDDLTPDLQIADFLREAAQVSALQVLTNGENLGFVGSVNRALALVADGDVILLNSDTVVPPGFVGKLGRSAYSAPDIGTVTPLSNNGEFTSFPVAFRVNPLPDTQHLISVDRAAGIANDGAVVDIPNGIGFCMYITRACLDAVGGLSTHYYRGYLEDVDFCLRARDRGFRNVCATSLYVGHQGSASFGSEKRSLVMLNLQRLEALYPDYRAECAAFMNADPLLIVRSAVEKLLPSPSMGATLLVSRTGGAIEALVSDQADKLLAKNEPVLVASYCNFRGCVTIAAVAGDIPQSISFDLSDRSDRAPLRSYLSSLELSRIQILDPAGISLRLVDELVSLGVPFDVMITDAGLICPAGAAIAIDGKACSYLGEKGPCRPCPDSSPRDWQRKWRNIVLKAAAILVPCSRALGFAGTILKTLGAEERLPSIAVQNETPGWAGADGIAVSMKKARALGIVLVGHHVCDFKTVCAIVQTFAQFGPGASIIVIGQSVDDLALMRAPDVFVTGAVDVQDLGEIAARYGVKALFVAKHSPLFGHPGIEFALSQTVLPVASIGWSSSQASSTSRRLVLDPQLSDALVATRLFRWFAEL